MKSRRLKTLSVTWNERKVEQRSQPDYLMTRSSIIYTSSGFLGNSATVSSFNKSRTIWIPQPVLLWFTTTFPTHSYFVIYPIYNITYCGITKKKAINKSNHSSLSNNSLGITGTSTATNFGQSKISIMHMFLCVSGKID